MNMTVSIAQINVLFIAYDGKRVFTEHSYV